MNIKTIEGDLVVNEAKFCLVVSRWNSFIVDSLEAGAIDTLKRHGAGNDDIVVVRVPGAFEMPVVLEKVAASGRYDAVICAAFVVDGGIYRHDYVAQAVVDGLMRAGLDTGVPVLSVSLTPHHYQETEHHNAIYRAHFVTKGREAAQAALGILKARAGLAQTQAA